MSEKLSRHKRRNKLILYEFGISECKIIPRVNVNYATVHLAVNEFKILEKLIDHMRNGH